MCMIHLVWPLDLDIWHFSPGILINFNLVLGHEDPYYVKEHSKSEYSEYDIFMLELLVEIIAGF